MKGPPVSETLEDLLREVRTFPPSAEFSASANAQPGIYEAADADHQAFWMAQARQRVSWFREPTVALDDSNPPFFTWFADGTLNLSYNCLDRHLEDSGDKVAYHWVGEPGDTRTLSYRDLYAEVCRFANALRSLGVQRGDRVAIYMGMIPELPIAMLACARIGAVHSVVFGGFSSDALADRILDADARLVITQDGAWRGGNVVPLKANTDVSLARTPDVRHCVVVKRTDSDVTMIDDRDIWWHDIVADQPGECEPVELGAEDPLYILYTSGTTGRPKGIVHTQGGYLTSVAATHSLVFDLKPDTDVYWCAADIGWVTGHSYIVYGPLANRTTGVIYEGAPNHPDLDRLWSIIAEYGVTILYTAPTAIRSFMKWGDEYPARHDLSSLRLLGSVGEPINPEAWIWYHHNIGGGRCPIVDTWWQTETGAIMITPLPGLTETKPGTATRPFPGIEATILTDSGDEAHAGYLAITTPWPAMLRTIWGDDQRYRDTYWSKWKDVYFPGDGAKRDDDGYFWILGRVDDVLNVAGHRIGTMEVESALVDHRSVVEAAVVGKSHDIKGESIAAFVTLKEGVAYSEALMAELREHVAKKIGSIAKPEMVVFTADLPKTRSGKIMRRLLRDIAEGRALGDTTTLADPNVVATLKDQYEDRE